MPIKFYSINLLIIGLILLPNILSAVFPPVNIPVQPKRPPWWIIVIALEWIGRIGIFILPLFWQIGFDRNKLIFLIPMGLMIAIYYMGWIRFFAKGREYRLLFEPLFRIPIPLALSPVLCIFFMGFAQGSWPVVAAAIIMALGHIPESIQNFQSTR
ncbi:MAG: hypothetical protein JXB33_11120 [Clostridia bacterium]|nr:hypothetical protein [Clostridia bacterium]